MVMEFTLREWSDIAYYQTLDLDGLKLNAVEFER